MKIIVHVCTDKVGSDCETEIEVEDDCSDGEIDEISREAMFGMIEWGWKREGEARRSAERQAPL